ncbi:MAG: CPXCG motif-containing cysteine-rich protein [Crocinitomicaceae bacterium]|nr:CPXCG motif-containing cysteine-rich protein [Crocinitomicaceae bacterium]|tara:strand:+ start:378 stop:560 length:183 start_codon:yes stop_codon:yes gene_type:complete
MIEQFFECPYCWQNISMLLDFSIVRQQYIEDCENCCNPIQVNFVVESQEISFFSANSIEQ